MKNIKVLLIIFISLLIYDFNILTPSSDKVNIPNTKCIDKKNFESNQNPDEQYYSDIFCGKNFVWITDGIKTVDCTTEIKDMDYYQCYTVTKFSFVRLFICLIFICLIILFI